MCNVSQRVTDIFPTSIHGSPVAKKKFGNPIPVECKSHRQSFIEVWSALQLDRGVKRGDGVRCGSCTAVHLHSLHLGGGGDRPPRTPWSQECETCAMWCKAVFGEETKKVLWLFHRCLPAYYSIQFPKEDDFIAIARYLLWIPKDRETVLLAYYRLREHWDSTGERGKPLNNCTNTGWSLVWCAWLQMSVCWEMLW